MTTKTAKLFRNGRSQAVRLPAEFRFEGTEVSIRRDPETGDVILSETNQAKDTWKDFLEVAARLRAEAPQEFEGFMEDRLRLSSLNPATPSDARVPALPEPVRSWDEYFAMVDRLKAEAPEEFAGFMQDRKKRPPKDRELF